MTDLILTIGLALIVLLIAWLVSRCEQKQLFEKFPALTDDEFMARLPSGTSRDTAIRVRNIVAHQVGLPPEHIHPEARFDELI